MNSKLMEYEKFKDDLAICLYKLQADAKSIMHQTRDKINLLEHQPYTLRTKTKLKEYNKRLNYYSGIKDTCFKINEWCKQKETTLEEEIKMNEKSIHDQILEEHKKKELQRYYYIISSIPSFLSCKYDNREDAFKQAIISNGAKINVYNKEDDRLVGEFIRDGLGWEYAQHEFEPLD